MASVNFLGTGGGRYVILTQKRSSGGIWLDLETQIILDPGPGSLVKSIQYGRNPQKLDAVFVSHHHLDHYNDAAVMVEAMTHGMKKQRGFLVLGGRSFEYISEYHRSLVSVITPKPGEIFQINRLKVQAIPTHNHEDALGYRFMSEYGVVSYTSDTGYSEELIPYYKDSRILILNTIFPSSKKIDVHLNTETASKIIGKAKPDLAVLNHFGMTMLSAGPEAEARKIEEETDVRTIPARDGMLIDLQSLNIKSLTKKGFTEKQFSLDMFMGD